MLTRIIKQKTNYHTKCLDSYFHLSDLMMKISYSDDYNEINHRYTIGRKINNLRKIIPNFSFTYCHFKASKPIESFLNWCNKNGNTYYLVEEYISNITLSEYIHYIKEEEFLSVILQLLYSLEIAHELIDFTHYDLNISNIKIKKLYSPVYIKYKNNYVYTDIIPVITDFSLSHIKNKGISNYTHLHIYPYNSHPIHDIYKIIMYSALASIEDNPSIYQCCKKIHKYFSKDDIYIYLNKLSSIYYSIAPNDDFTINSLIYYVENNFPLKTILSKNIKNNILQCIDKSYKMEFVDKINKDINVLSTDTLLLLKIKELYYLIDEMLIYQNSNKKSISYIKNSKYEYTKNKIDDFEKYIQQNNFNNYNVIIISIKNDFDISFRYIIYNLYYYIYNKYKYVKNFIDSKQYKTIIKILTTVNHNIIEWNKKIN